MSAKLKSTTKSFIVVDYNNLDSFIQEVTGVKDYEFMAAEEGPKDGYAHVIVTGDVDTFEEERFKQFKAGQIQTYITGVIMNKLCKEGLIPAGTYLVSCFW
jgi:hypothetical protein